MDEETLTLLRQARNLPTLAQFELWEALSHALFDEALTVEGAFEEQPVMTLDARAAALEGAARELERAAAIASRVSRSADATLHALAARHHGVHRERDGIEWESMDDRDFPLTPGEFAADALSGALGVTSGRAEAMATDAERLRRCLRPLFEEAGAGRSRMSAVVKVSDMLEHLDDEQIAAALPHLMRAKVVSVGPSAAANRTAGVLDALGLSETADEVELRAELGVWFAPHPEHPTLTEMRAVLPAREACELKTAIHAHAQELRESAPHVLDCGLRDPIDALRADALLLLALANVHVTPVLHLQVPVTAGQRLGAQEAGDAGLAHQAATFIWTDDDAATTGRTFGQALGEFPPMTPMRISPESVEPCGPGDAAGTRGTGGRILPADPRGTGLPDPLGHEHVRSHSGPPERLSPPGPTAPFATQHTPSRGAELSPAIEESSRTVNLTAEHRCAPCGEQERGVGAEPCVTNEPMRTDARHATGGTRVTGSAAGACSGRQVSGHGSAGFPSTPHVTLSDVSSANVPGTFGDVRVPGVGTLTASVVEGLSRVVGAVFLMELVEATTWTTVATTTQKYRPSTAIRTLVEKRDRHCRFPWCSRPAAVCDADHVVPFADGGETSAANLQMLCRHHHRAKTFGGWAVQMSADGVCTWQSPSGPMMHTFPGDAVPEPLTPARTSRPGADTHTGDHAPLRA